MKKAIYPGSFDPITNGHLDIVRRATTVFDKVYIAVLENPSKAPFFTLDERIRLIKKVIGKDPKIQVVGFHGLLVDLAKEKNIFTIIRGLRAVSDFEMEFQIALTNRTLHPKIDTVFLMTDFKYSYLSSSIVKQLAKYNGEIKAFVPSLVEKALKEKMAK